MRKQLHNSPISKGNDFSHINDHKPYIRAAPDMPVLSFIGNKTLLTLPNISCRHNKAPMLVEAPTLEYKWR